MLAQAGVNFLVLNILLYQMDPLLLYSFVSVFLYWYILLNINIKMCNTEQAKRIYQYKNTKTKLYKSNGSIWYNKIFRQES
jgi:hypothetical protein